MLQMTDPTTSRELTTAKRQWVDFMKELKNGMNVSQSS